LLWAFTDAMVAVVSKWKLIVTPVFLMGPNN